MASGPLSDSLAYRLSGNANQVNGYYDNGGTQEDFNEFTSRMVVHTVKAGTVILQEGGRGNSVYVIAGGSVKVYTTLLSGEHVELENLGRDDRSGDRRSRNQREPPPSPRKGDQHERSRQEHERGSGDAVEKTVGGPRDLRILDLPACLAQTHLPGTEGVSFNLLMTDPI